MRMPLPYAAALSLVLTAFPRAAFSQKSMAPALPPSPIGGAIGSAGVAASFPGAGTRGSAAVVIGEDPSAFYKAPPIPEVLRHQLTLDPVTVALSLSVRTGAGSFDEVSSLLREAVAGSLATDRGLAGRIEQAYGPELASSLKAFGVAVAEAAKTDPRLEAHVKALSATAAKDRWFVDRTVNFALRTAQALTAGAQTEAAAFPTGEGASVDASLRDGDAASSPAEARLTKPAPAAGAAEEPGEAAQKRPFDWIPPWSDAKELRAVADGRWATVYFASPRGGIFYGGLRSVDLETGQELVRLREERITAISPAGRWVATEGADGVIRIRRGDRGLELVRSFRGEPPRAITDDGLSATLREANQEAAVLLRDEETGTARREVSLGLAAESVRDLQFSPDLSRFAFTRKGWFGPIQVWGVSEGRPILETRRLESVWFNEDWTQVHLHNFDSDYYTYAIDPSAPLRPKPLHRKVLSPPWQIYLYEAPVVMLGALGAFPVAGALANEPFPIGFMAFWTYMLLVAGVALFGFGIFRRKEW